ncbi:MAG: hypothetical protein Q8911_17095 [Bacillota bacterium]|nr:hypothetical protein [Bacillota bacterium]
MNAANTMMQTGQKSMSNAQKARTCNTKPKSSSAINATKFWGIWLPVPTFLAIVNSIFWTWLILSTVGYTESPIEKAGGWIIDEF